MHGAAAVAAAAAAPVVFTPRQRRSNQWCVNERCLRRLIPDLEDFHRVGHTAVYRYYADGVAGESSSSARWVSKRVEGQLFVAKSRTATGVRCPNNMRCALPCFITH